MKCLLPLSAAILQSMALFLFSCASAPESLAPQTGREIPADFSGLVHAGGTNTSEEFAFLDYMGTGWILHTFYWSRIESEQGEWDFINYDTLVDNAEAAGIKVLGVLAYDNRWIHTDRKSHNYIPPARLPDYLEYVRKTVDHFRGRVDAWCIWNEPNFHFWTGTGKEFFELARQAADVIRETDNEVILLGGAFNRGVFGLPKKYIRGLFESGAMEKADAVAFHPYELNPGRTARLYDQFREIVDDYGFGDKIWITEVGYPTGGWYPTRISEKNLPAYVIKTCVLLLTRGSQKVFWYQLFDPHRRNGGNSEDFFGLAQSDYSSKGAEAFRLCAQFLSGSSYRAQELRRENLPNSLRSFYFEGDGNCVLILWNESPGERQVRLLLSGTGHTRHDPVSGSASVLQMETVVKAGSMPVFITWQGGTEKPLIRAFSKIPF